MWNDRLNLTPLRGIEMIDDRGVRRRGSHRRHHRTHRRLSWARHMEAGVRAPEVNQWYKDQQLNDATWKRLGSPSWNGLGCGTDN